MSEEAFFFDDWHKIFYSEMLYKEHVLLTFFTVLLQHNQIPWVSLGTFISLCWYGCVVMLAIISGHELRDLNRFFEKININCYVILEMNILPPNRKNTRTRWLIINLIHFLCERLAKVLLRHHTALMEVCERQLENMSAHVCTESHAQSSITFTWTMTKFLHLHSPFSLPILNLNFMVVVNHCCSFAYI